MDEGDFEPRLLLERLSDAGEGKPVLICLHGSFGSAEDWKPLSRALEGDASVLAVEFPSRGKYLGSSIEEEVWCVEFFSWELARLLSEYEGAFLLGYSFGGRVALSCALRESPKLSGLILESASPGIEEKQARAERLEKDRGIARKLIESDTKAFFENWYSAPLFQSLSARSDLKTPLIETLTKEVDTEEAARLMLEASPGAMVNYWPKLSDIDTKTLYISGALDAKYSDFGEQVATCSPLINNLRIEGAGHNVHLEAAERFAEIVRSFITGE